MYRVDRATVPRRAVSAAVSPPRLTSLSSSLHALERHLSRMVLLRQNLIDKYHG